ncbi:MAG: alpha/beta fold hydrolase [Hyphomicrobiaceae bacterium]
MTTATKRAYVTASDGVRLYTETTGDGDPIVFVHEFAGHHLSWETQVRWFSRRYKCVTYQARGWPPSDVPTNVDSYSQARAADDIADVISGLGLGKAHVVGLSMGATAAIELAIRHPGKALSIAAAGAGTGSTRDADKLARFRREAEEMALRIERDGIAALGDVYLAGPARQQLARKDPRGQAEMKLQFIEGASKGRAMTMRGVQARRAPFFDREAVLRAIRDPVLIICGDEDDGTLDVSVFMKRVIPRCGLMVFPKTGHGINLEEPAGFNAVVGDFIHAVERGRWAESVSTAGKDFSLLPKS